MTAMNRCARFALVSIATFAAATTLAGCGQSSAPSAPAVAAQLTALAGSVPPAAPISTDRAAPSSVLDPCQKLTKADVQPFFTVPVVTELPDAWDTPTTKGCEFSVAGLSGTSIGIKVVGGDDAQTMQQLQKADTQEVTFSGVGVVAEHPHGSTEFTAQEGTTANPAYCAVSTTGWKELAGKKDLADVTQIPDATATTIAQQYGTLCNRLFGSGNVTPTMTVAAPAVSGSAPASGGPTPATGAVLVTAGTIGPGFPTPQGLDCSGTKTTTDSEGTVDCETTTTDGKAIYLYYLRVLPTKGYTINHEAEQSGTTGEVASLLFEGPGVAGFSSLSIVGPNVSITLRKG